MSQRTKGAGDTTLRSLPKKILQSENVITEPPPVVTEDISVPVAKHNYGENLVDIKTFLKTTDQQRRPRGRAGKRTHDQRT